MNILPPSYVFNGDREKAISLKSQALQFYNYISSKAQREGISSIFRTKILDDGSTISVYSNTQSNYNNRAGKIVIFSPGKEKKYPKIFYPYLQIIDGTPSTFTHTAALFSYDRKNPVSFSWENSEGYFKQRNQNPHSSIGGGVYNAGEYFTPDRPINTTICNKYKYSDTGDLITYTGLFGPGYLTKPLIQDGWVFYNGKRFSFNCNEIFDVVVRAGIMWVLGGSNGVDGFLYLYKLVIHDGLLLDNFFDNSISIFDTTIASSGNISISYLPPNTLIRSSFGTSITGYYNNARIVDAKFHPDLTEFSVLIQINDRFDPTLSGDVYLELSPASHTSIDLTCSIVNGGIESIIETLYEYEAVVVKANYNNYNNLATSPQTTYNVFGIEKFIDLNSTRFNVPDADPPTYFYDDYYLQHHYVYLESNLYSDAGYTVTYSAIPGSIKCGYTYKSGSKEFILYGFQNQQDLVFNFVKYDFESTVKRNTYINPSYPELTPLEGHYLVSPAGTPITDVFPELIGIPQGTYNEYGIDGETAATSIQPLVLLTGSILEKVSGGRFTPGYYIGNDITTASLLGHGTLGIDYTGISPIAGKAQEVIRHGTSPQTSTISNTFDKFKYNYLRDNSSESTYIWVNHGVSRLVRYAIIPTLFDQYWSGRYLNLHEKYDGSIVCFDPENGILLRDYYDSLAIDTLRTVNTDISGNVVITYPVISSYSEYKKYGYLNGQEILLKELQIPVVVPDISSIPGTPIDSYITPDFHENYSWNVNGNTTFYKSGYFSYLYDPIGLGSILETSSGTYTFGITGYNNELLSNGLELLEAVAAPPASDYTYVTHTLPNELRKHVNLIQVRSGNMQNLESEPTSLLMTETPPFPLPDPVPNNISSIDINTDAYEYKITYCGIAG